MIRHIVLFKMKPFESESVRADKLNEIKKGLDRLPAIIPQLRLMKVGINMNAAEQYDLSLLTEFDNMADLQTYAVHPDHVAVSKIIREMLDARACVDSEF